MKKLFMSLAAVLIMVITGCGSSSDSAPESLSSQKKIQQAVTVSPSLSGSLDTTFGTNGIVTTPIGSSYGAAYALGIQSNGKIVTAGYSSNGSNYDFAIVRYNTDGSLDTRFGTGGKVTTPIGSGYDRALALSIQSDGRIVVAGTSSCNGSKYDFALVRYNTDGSLDTGFGTGGIVTTLTGSGNGAALALGIQSDGRIVAAGYSSNGGNYNYALVRYNTDGSLDTGFGTGGIVTTTAGSGYDRAYALSIQSDGRIVVAGTSCNGSNYDFVLMRYDTDGSLDTRFGTGFDMGYDTDSTVITPIGGSVNVAANAPSVQSKAMVVAAGNSGNNYYYACALGIQSDGRIVAAGYSDNGINYDFALMRYLP